MLQLIEPPCDSPVLTNKMVKVMPTRRPTFFILACLLLAIGAGLSLALSRLVGSMLFGLKPTDPSTYAMVLLSIAGIAILAAAAPAWRAARIDPMVALREE